MSKLGEATKYNADSVVAREPAVIYTLKRLNDGLTKTAQRVRFIDWDNDGTFHSSHDDVQVGRSLILDPINTRYTWLTTTITSIIEQKDKYIKFQTENSTYELIQYI